MERSNPERPSPPGMELMAESDKTEYERSVCALCVRLDPESKVMVAQDLACIMGRE